MSFKDADTNIETWEGKAKTDLYGARRSLMLVSLLRGRERRSTLKDGERHPSDPT